MAPKTSAVVSDVHEAVADQLGIEEFAAEILPAAKAEIVAELKAKGVKLQDEVPRPGHGSSQVAFLDQQSTGNLLIELVQMPADGTH